MSLLVELLFPSRFQSPGSYFGFIPASSSSLYSCGPNSQEYTLAVFRETLRLFPATVRTRRDAAFDTTLPCRVRDPDSGEWVSGPPVKVPAGVPCVLNIHGVHMSRMFGKSNVFSLILICSQRCIGVLTPRSSGLTGSSTPQATSGREKHVRILSYVQLLCNCPFDASSFCHLQGFLSLPARVSALVNASQHWRACASSLASCASIACRRRRRLRSWRQNNNGPG